MVAYYVVSVFKCDLLCEESDLSRWKLNSIPQVVGEKLVCLHSHMQLTLETSF